MTLAKYLLCGLVLVAFAPSLARADADTAKGPETRPINGTKVPTGTTYTPVYTAPSGVGVGVTSTTNGGTPSSAPTTNYGVGVHKDFH